jgi:hypothetical protein
MKQKTIKLVLKNILILNVYVFIGLLIGVVSKSIEAGVAITDAIINIVSNKYVALKYLEIILISNVAIFGYSLVLGLYAKFFPSKPSKIENSKKYLEIVNKKSVVDSKGAQHN